MSVTIYLNGKKEEIEKEMNLSNLLQAKKIRSEVVTVELNDKIIERDKYNDVFLQADDRLEFVYYMGGGEVNTKLADNVLELVGNTPMMRLNRIVGSDSAEILAKLEFFNPGGSVKDRFCISMIDVAEK